MTKFSHKAVTLLTLTATAAMASSAVNAATLEEIKKSGTVRIAVANEIPYGYVDPSGEAKGAGPDVAKAIMKTLGVEKIEWVATNFSSLIPGLQADRFDMVAAEMAILPDRCNQVLFSEPNTSYGEGLLVATGNPKNIHAFEDFAKKDGLKVAIMAGADQLEMMQKLGVDEANLVTISANADAISTVSTGRADAYAATSLTVGNLAEQSDGVELADKFTDPVVDGEAVRSWGGFTFAKGNETLRDAVNQALADVKKTDDWSKMVTSYGFTQSDLDGSLNRSTQELCSPSN
ncbi:ectoine/hydroxyectoine ABC transporter substrate-binding protein EhuB [Agrobacterium sp.]|jgi:polar amino acid transport system substrate-binding protein|uniref:ectoine/hydroxyectoine ABC transporter substrate-binding protein EhuB n=1 Tax=Agrobacterium sp. TaxID=361 RepID=UPI0028AA29B6|nr:ectoine/hydroxyectoine ABC transporter substrate-binding protein EhuB [Agrobacterium sp.]